MKHFSNLFRTILKPKTVGTMSSNLSQRSDDELFVFYNWFLIIVRKGKSHTIDNKLISSSVKEVFETVLHHKMSSAVIKSILLSNSTVKRRVDVMATKI